MKIRMNWLASLLALVMLLSTLTPILGHAAANIVDDQTHGILARVLAGIRLCIPLQHLQVGEERRVVRRILHRLLLRRIDRSGIGQAVVRVGGVC